jgi:diadenosine tetraphosphate (Ap4A) HIT family hydrolase
LLDLDLCAARLQLDARFPWVVLIPRRVGARELEDLAEQDLAILTREVLMAGRAVRAIGAVWDTSVEKLNIGALGNIVPQLHVHVVGRRTDDAAWPGPVWGLGRARPYADADLKQAMAAGRSALLGAAR